MRKLSLSVRIYIILIATYAFLAAVNIFLPQGIPFLPDYQLPSAKFTVALANAFVVLIFYGVLGLVGVKLSQKVNFVEIWDSRVSNRQRFLIPSLVGMCIGVFFIIIDTIFSKLHNLGRLPHPSFPTSLVASLGAAIGEEAAFRLFFIPFWLWLISYVVLKNKYQDQIFWVITVFSAIMFSFAHLPGVMFLYGVKSLNEIPIVLISEIVFLNGVLSIFSAYYLRRCGFLSSVSIHFWADVVWHVIWGAV